ncbi:RIP metalloprotease RseP [Neolewinella lacunae]|uniref:Zinc metalloprotease n=1 Tax=Neolewinella lacunae TaxID=1517758 RepID=A0A923PSL8_9BACT|nr:RIP metalloprotease RseP [Neolewinella lacunae]MBC6996037.1 RIP metalloprotease RseP [Neolewinella lacunae]MDN3635426.1 RIP metalloprotease RseP [Neolewinella lacunae]
MDTLITIGQLVLSLSILIVLHEFGHFLPARLFGTRVEKFYLFFDPYFSLFKKQIGETEYGIGWLPLGGYVKISGMIDESFDTEQMQSEPQPWEFRSKPAWQRLIIMLGGVTVNFILGFFIYAMVLFAYGEEYLPAKNATAGIAVDSLGQAMGLATGDQLLRIGEVPFDRFNDRAVLRAVAIDNVRELTVARNGSEQTITIDNKWADILTRHENKRERLFTPRIPFVLGLVAEDGPAAKAGLKKEDRIVSINGVPTAYYDEFEAAIRGRKNETVVFGVQSKDNTTVREVSVTTNEDGKIRVAPAPPEYFYKTERIEYGFLESFPAGFNQGVQFLGDQFKAFGEMFKGNIKVTESLGGFASIGSMFGKTWVWERFWFMTASLSLILAFMNLLPIPALDGGHVMFLLYEVVSGRKPSDKFMERATMVGFVIVLGLVVLANGLDIWRGIKGFFGG